MYQPKMSLSKWRRFINFTLESVNVDDTKQDQNHARITFEIHDEMGTNENFRMIFEENGCYEPRNNHGRTQHFLRLSLAEEERILLSINTIVYTFEQRCVSLSERQKQ